MNCEECGCRGGVFRDSVLINFEGRILCERCLVKWGRREKARLEHELEELLWKVYSARRKIAQIKQDGG
jgi:hypothetical protein